MRIGNFEDNQLELTPNARCDVDLSPHRSSQIAEFFLSRDFSDVQFEIDGERIPTHRCILASSCDYFQVLFYGGMREQFEEVVRLQDVSLSAFKAILRQAGIEWEIVSDTFILVSLHCIIVEKIFWTFSAWLISIT